MRKPTITAASPTVTKAITTAPSPTTTRRWSLKPKYAIASYNRGNAYYDKRDHDRAIAGLRSGDQDGPEIHHRLLRPRRRLSTTSANTTGAIEDLTQAIALDPKDALAYYNRGITYRAKGEIDRAIADFDQAVKLDPKIALAFSIAVWSYKDKGDDSIAPSPTTVGRSGSIRRIRSRLFNRGAAYGEQARL